MNSYFDARTLIHGAVYAFYMHIYFVLRLYGADDLTELGRQATRLIPFILWLLIISGLLVARIQNKGFRQYGINHALVFLIFLATVLISELCFFNVDFADIN